MNQTTQTIIRTVLMIAGSFLIGHHIYSTVIDPTWWDAASGILISITMLVWGIFSKTTSADALVAGIKQVLVFVGGIMVASGKLSAASLNTWLGVISALLPAILSLVYKQQTEPTTPVVPISSAPKS